MRFIRLTRTIINTSHVSRVVHENQKYVIYMANHHVSGLLFFGNGGMDTEENKMIVCKEKHPDDYITMNLWWINAGCK